MKHILITGSTDGIGKLTALKLAKEGHTVYVHGRNEVKVRGLVAAIKAAANNENIHGLVADFSDLKAVKKLGDQINNGIPKIDVLINNAGILKSPLDKTKDGFDIRIAVNFFAPYLLTNAILSSIKKANAPRIINLSSAAQASVSTAVLSGKEGVADNNSYAQSKLALTMWSMYLAEQAPEITVIAVNPGSLLNTKMAKEAYGQYWSPAEKGLDVLYDLALSENHNNNSGKYYDNDQGDFSHAHQDAYNQDKIQQLIVETNKLLKL